MSGVDAKYKDPMYCNVRTRYLTYFKHFDSLNECLNFHGSLEAFWRRV